MCAFLGIDTSNYTTSCAAFINSAVIQEKMLLPVKQGECGLRQSDAVFHHTQQLPKVMERLVPRLDGRIDAIGVSAKPRQEEGSYMPCFTVGVGCAKTLSLVLDVPLYEFSHQQGHVAAALYSAGRLGLLKTPFLAFHVSGGTTEALHVIPDENELFITRIAAKTLDLNAGQAIDRVGVMLGLSFPCGAELEKLALSCNENISVSPALKGCDCCLSGVENRCRQLLSQGASREYIAAFCLEYIRRTLYEMTVRLQKQYGNLPLLYAGGVMSNTIIRSSFERDFGALFAQPEYASDNAAGIAVLAAARHGGITL